MNRREFLSQLSLFCAMYGIQGILSRNSFASTGPKRMVNFIVKYTGGGTSGSGVGHWHTGSNGMLSSLAPYSGQMTVPLGLNSEFHAPMNSHAAPQVCALSGSMTGFELRETYYPLGNLQNYTSGDGKSIDVLIGEKLQAQYKTQIPYLLITNYDSDYLACTHRTSSWGKDGNLIHSFQTTAALRNEISNRLICEKYDLETYNRRLKAMEHIKRAKNIFASSYLIDKTNFERIEQNLNIGIQRYKTNISNIQSRGVVPCSSLAARSEIPLSQVNRLQFQNKMDQMYDLALIALEQNITRVVTFNLFSEETHATSHFSTMNPFEMYLDAGKFVQDSISKFVTKLKEAGLYEETLFYCNAGSCSENDVHTYDNLSIFLLNAGVPGVVGSAGAKKPVGCLLADILKKFGIHYDQYGGKDHRYGIGKPGSFL